MSKKIVVGLIFGGRSAEHDVSLDSSLAVHRNLVKAGFEVVSFYITKKGLWKRVSAPTKDPRVLAVGESYSFLPWGQRSLPPRLRADIYFPVLHGPFGEDGTIQGLFEMAGVPYVGAGVLGSAVGMDKASAKSILRDRGLPVVPWVEVTEREWPEGAAGVRRRIREDLSYPVFVKPSGMGSSVGVTKVKNPRGLGEALRRAFVFDAKVLVEKAVSGREIECSVLGNEEPAASAPGEVIPSREFYDYADKYKEGKAGLIIPARLPRAAAAEVRRLAVGTFKALSCSGLARVDFFLEEGTNAVFVNEINTMPGFTEISMYAKLWAAAGLPFPRLVAKLVTLGLERFKGKKVQVERDAA